MTDFETLRDEFVAIRPRFVEIADECERLLRDNSAPLDRKMWQFTSRVKEPGSFLIKALYRDKPYADPMRNIEDIAGARIVVGDLTAVRRASEMVSRVLADNGYAVSDPDDKRVTVDDGKKSYRVSYRGTHFIAFDTKRDNLPVEVQIHTKAESAWAEASHSLVYKPLVALPSEYRRKVKRLLALVELFDEQIETVQDMVKNDADYEALGLVDFLAGRFFDLAGRDPQSWDRVFAVEHCRQILSMVSSADARALTDSLITTEGDKLREFYSNYSEGDRVLLAAQPESLAFLALIRQKRITLQKAMQSGDMERELIERLASGYGAALTT